MNAQNDASAITGENAPVNLKPSSARTNRETGFEILRILAILLISCVHVMNYGGLLGNATDGIGLLTQRLLYAIFTTSVNVFVLTSAYFLVKSRFKIKKVLFLWIQVFAYTIISYLVCIIINPQEFSLQNFFFCFIPITNQKYWFFTAYILVYLFSPFLNLMLNNASKKSLTILVIGLFVFSWLSTRFNIASVASISSGYSVIWFIMLYIVGGYLRLYPPRIKKIWVFCVYLACTLALWGMSYMTNSNFFTNLIYQSLDYNTPLVLLASACLILLFRDIRIKNETVHRIICFVSSCSFGIYLFQESHIKPYIYFNILHVESAYGSPWSACYVLLFALGIFAMGFAVEIIRKLIVGLSKKAITKIKGKLSSRPKE